MSPPEDPNSSTARFGLRWLLPLLFLAMAVVVVVFNDASPAAVATATVLLLLAAISRAMTPGDLRRRVMSMTSLSFGGATAEFQADAQAALAELPANDDDVSEGDLAGLRTLLDAKLAYVAKHLLVEPVVTVSEDGRGAPIPVEPAQYAPSFATIGSLEYDGLLTSAMASVCHRILTIPEGEFRSLSATDRERFLDEGSKVVGRFRAAVFQGQVRQVLERRFKRVTEEEREVAPQRGFAVEGARGWVLIVPVFDVPGSNASLPEARDKMVELGDDYWVRIIVVPTLGNRTAPTTADEAVRVVRFDQLEDVAGDLLPGD